MVEWIRHFERLREGIQDFEKLRIVKQKLQAAGTEDAQRKLAELNRLLSGHFQEAHHKSCSTAVNAAKKALTEAARYCAGQTRTSTD